MSACRRADGADADAEVDAGKNRSKSCCTNIAVMQLFHELKQQFPTVPDDVVSACIMDHCHDRPACRQRLQEAAAIAVPRTLPRPSPQPQMTTIPPPPQTPIGKPPISPSIPNKRFPPSQSSITRSAKPEATVLNREPQESEICGAVSVTDLSRHFTQQCEVNSSAGVKGKAPPRLPPSPVRPATLDLTGQGQGQGQSPSRLAHTCENVSPVAGSVNVSLNVNCSINPGPGSPVATRTRKHSSALQVTPEPVWCQHMSSARSGIGMGMGSAADSSPRSYTSVNLTLRTPTSDPQAPIDICSSPATGPSLTYTTSSFDRRQGLESCLQITVGPGAGLGQVTALRTRPHSTVYHPETVPNEQPTSPLSVRAPSLPDLVHREVVAAASNHVVLLSKQFQRKEQLKSELEAGRERLNAIQKEVQALQLENSPEFRTRLKKEIRHLQAQCERLTGDVDRHSESGGGVPLGEVNADFYRHIYKGQRGSLRPRQNIQQQHQQQQIQTGQQHISAVIHPSVGLDSSDNEPHWQCHLCTFRNHPLMNKCEQCEMPRVLLVSAGPGENIHIRFSPGNTTRVIHSWVV